MSANLKAQEGHGFGEHVPDWPHQRNNHCDAAQRVGCGLPPCRVWSTHSCDSWRTGSGLGDMSTDGVVYMPWTSTVRYLGLLPRVSPLPPHLHRPLRHCLTASPSWTSAVHSHFIAFLLCGRASYDGRVHPSCTQDTMHTIGAASPRWHLWRR